MITPSMIKESAEKSGHSITLAEAIAILACVAAKMALGSDLKNAVRKCLD
jgi:hypothetical protein